MVPGKIWFLTECFNMRSQLKEQRLMLCDLLPKKIMKTLITFVVFVPLLIPTCKGLVCLRCENVASNDECERIGRNETCTGQSDACKTEIRVIDNGRKHITKGCKQRSACINNIRLAFCESQPPNSKCYCCCDGDRCNRGGLSCFPSREGSQGLFSDGTRGNFDRTLPRPLPFSDQILTDDLTFRGGTCLPHLVDPFHGSVRCSDNNFPGSRCVFSCDRDYVLRGEDSLICRKSGLWAGVPPTCAQQTCSNEYTSLVNGLVSCTRANGPRSTCRYSCKPGNRLIGTNQVTCLVNARQVFWSHAKPRCVNIARSARCSIMQVPDNGAVSCTRRHRGGSRCTFSCLPGYRRNGAASTTCLFRSGIASWNNRAATCKDIDECKTNAHKCAETAQCVNTDGNYTCVCEAGFVWNGLSCRDEDECFTLESNCDRNAQCSNTHGSYKCSCDEGYSGDGLICTAILPTCPTFKDMPNALVDCTQGVQVGTTCRVSCGPGFGLIGNDELRCKQDEEGKVVWDFQWPTCERECPEIPPIENGLIECLDGKVLGATCSFNCRRDFDLVGKYEATCIEKDGQVAWDTSPADCQKICSEIGDFPTGTVACTNSNFLGTVCTYDCENGFVLAGQRQIECTASADGIAAWSGAAPMCTKFCPVLNIDNGFVECDDSEKLDSVCRFSCEELYTLNGARATACVDSIFGDAGWSNATPVCEKYCPQIELDNGNWVCTSITPSVDTLCIFSCDDNYQLVGTRVASCQDNDKGMAAWSEDPPLCKKLCPSLSFASGSLTCSGGHVGAVCNFECPPTKVLLGRESAICIENDAGVATWSTSPPICEKHCRRFTLASGKAQCSSEIYTSSTLCEFTCDPGYGLIGSETVICQEQFDGNTRWSAEIPVCIKRCPPLTLPLGSVECDGDTVGSTCNFKCSEVASLIGSSRSTCIENVEGDATWTNLLPVCERNFCPELNPVTNGNWTCTEDALVDSKCTYSCLGKYRVAPLHEPTTTCLVDQTWSEIAPCCSMPCPDNPLMDVLVILDSSSSVGLSSWRIMVNFVQTIVRAHELMEDGTCFAVMRYNSKVDRKSFVPFNYGKRFGKAALLNKIGAMPYDGSGTNTGGALRYALNRVFSSRMGSREDAKEVVIVLTDGKSQDDVAVPAMKLRNKGVLIFALGVQSSRGKLDVDQLESIVGVKNHLFVFREGFASLTEDFAMELSDAVCHDPCYDEPEHH
ncbi:unnamed protein product [Clavelina lepadiformis]|uniref:Uncharacterized protein n=1 Tax=Clavelina lepadiformis TaxID=159417 RepID=A0ABP0FJN5_CLALP